MIDLAPVLDVLAGQHTWSPAEAMATMNTLAAAGLAEVDWDEFAGESWGRLLVGDQVAAFVSMRRPFALVAEQYAATITAAAGASAMLIAVPSLDALVLTGDRDQLAMIFGSGARSAALDPASFSADELWFATV